MYFYCTTQIDDYHKVGISSSLAGIKKRLISWRYLDKSLSSSNKQKIFDAFRLYKKHLNFSYFKTIVCVFRLSINSVIKKKNIYN